MTCLSKTCHCSRYPAQPLLYVAAMQMQTRLQILSQTCLRRSLLTAMMLLLVLMGWAFPVVLPSLISSIKVTILYVFSLVLKPTLNLWSQKWQFHFSSIYFCVVIADYCIRALNSSVCHCTLVGCSILTVFTCLCILLIKALQLLVKCSVHSVVLNY